MVLLIQALNKIRDEIEANITNGELGTDGTATSDTQTGLLSADVTTNLSLDSITKTDRQIKFDYVLPSTGGTTGTYREFELNDANDSNISYDRIVFTGITFTTGGTEDINISKRYFIKQV